MTITSIRYADGELHLGCSPREGVRASYELKPGEYDIRPKPKKRSMTANSYCWVLVDKIAAEMGLPPLEVYRAAIDNLGGVTATMMRCRKEAVPAFIQGWEAGHLGRQVKQLGEVDGMVDLMVVYGSSDYDRIQMARLLDRLTQDAHALGIETRSPEDVESLLNSWNKN
jgi:hypothetical protein